MEAKDLLPSLLLRFLLQHLRIKDPKISEQHKQRENNKNYVVEEGEGFKHG